MSGKTVLSGLQVPNAFLAWVKLPKANLQKANFNRAVVDHAEFSGANL